MTILRDIQLPLSCRCNACGRKWLQDEPWEVGDLLLCQCGEPAYVALPICIGCDDGSKVWAAGARRQG